MGRNKVRKEQIEKKRQEILEIWEKGRKKCLRK